MDVTNVGIPLAPIPTPMVQIYVTTLLTELRECHETLSMDHAQLQQKHQL